MTEGDPLAAADWEQTFDAVTDPMAILTPDYRVVRANAAYLAWMHTARGRCEGHECFVHAGERECPCESCPLPRTVATARPCYVRQVRMQPDRAQEASGAVAPRIYETWTYPVTGADGRVERVVEIIRDVTERERLQQVTSEARALREADQLKTELLGTVSHELRSPLASIKGYAATLLKHEQRLSAEERREFLQAIVEASDRLTSVIEAMLDMSQLEAAGAQLTSAPVDVARLACEAVGAAEAGLDADGASSRSASFTFTCSLQTSDGTDAVRQLRERRGPRRPQRFTILGDAGRLRSVLDQLLANAVKYSPSGGTIAVTVRRFHPEAGRTVGPGEEHGSPLGADQPDQPVLPEMVEVVVQDTGIGIPPDQLGRVFDRFHRVDTRLTREADGLGLGLAIARRVVELHGGAIWAESVAGGGSSFHMVLPLAPAEAEEPAGEI